MLGGYSDTPIFVHLGASSWHRGDAAAILKIGKVVTWLLEPWKVIMISLIGLAACVWCYRRRVRRACRTRASDVELFDTEREMFLEAMEGGSQTHTQARSRGGLGLLPVWVWPVSIYPTTSPANEEARPRRSMSPASFVSSSDCTLREDDMEVDEMKER